MKESTTASLRARLGLALVFSSTLLAQSPILATIDKLQKFPVDEMNTDVPAALGPLHQQLKHQLRDFVFDALNRGADVQTELEKAGIRMGEQGRYGQVLGVKVEWKPNGLATWAAVTTTLGVMCGEDMSLYLLEHDGKVWRLRLALESELSKDVSSAHGWLQYRLSRAGTDDRFFVVAANMNPWCTSVWQRLRIDAFIIEPMSRTAKRVLKEETSICIDDELGIKVQDSTFTIEYLAEEGFLPGNRRTHVLSYAIGEGATRRVAPIALKPEDFVDEWRSLPWSEAKRWSSNQLEPWHTILKEVKFDDVPVVQPCATKNRQWQVAVPLPGDDEKAPELQEASHIYATVIERDANFYMQGIGTKHAPGCPADTPPQ
ncbi:MAG TPA: hypothetical protein VEU96_07555 [Bryobacteraceae bacterium]|nr:hypothetical protein [Bryobacteraceae bacterium]